MAITIPTGAGNIGSTSNGATSITTIPMPLNVANGDCLIAVLYNQLSGGTIASIPTGWTKIYQTVASGTRIHAVFYHKVTDTLSEPAAYTWTTSASGRNLGNIFRVLGVGEGVVDALPVLDTFPAGNPAIIPGISTVASNAVLFGTVITNNSGVTYPHPTSSGYTEVFYNTVTTTGTSTSTLFFQQLSAAGPTGNIPLTWDANVATNAGTFAFSLSPVDAVIPPPVIPPGTIGFPSTSNDFGLYSAGNVNTIPVPVPANVQDGDVLLALIYCQTSGSVVTPPNGWTLIYKTTASGTRGFGLYYRKVSNRNSEIVQGTYTWTNSLSTRVIGKIFRGVGLGSAVFDALPSSDTFNNFVTTTNVNPSITAVGSNAMLLACSFTNNSSLVYPLSSSPGFTKLFDDISTASPSTSTMSLLYKLLSAAGPTGSQTVTFDQSAATSGGFLLTLQGVPPVAPGKTYLQTWAERTPAYTAHRDGFYAVHGEFTLAGYTALKTWNYNVAWNIDVFKTLDGVWVASHDATTGRVLDGPSVDIRTVNWADISSKKTLVGGNPVATLDQIVAIAYPGTIFYLDNKGNSNQDELLTKLQSLNMTPANTVIKNYAGSNANNTWARTNNYQIWMYFFDADVATYGANLISPDWVGFDYNGTQANWNTLIATGRPSFAHILPSLAAKDTADTKAAAAGGTNFGYMVSNVEAVVPKMTAPPGASNQDLELVFYPDTGSIQDRRADNWEGNVRINGFGYAYRAEFSGSVDDLSAQDRELAQGQAISGQSTYSIADTRRVRYGG